MSTKRIKRIKGEIIGIDIVNTLTEFKIFGTMCSRIEWIGPGKCPSCHCRSGALHIIPCKLEESPCGIHSTAWECTCEIEEGDVS